MPAEGRKQEQITQLQEPATPKGGSWRAGTSLPESAGFPPSALGSCAEPLKRAILEGKRPSKKAIRGSTVSNLTHQHRLKSNETKLYLKSRAQPAKERVLLLPAELRNLN